MNNITPMPMINKMIIIKGAAIIGQYGSLHPMMFSSATTGQHARTEREGIDADQANGVSGDVQAGMDAYCLKGSTIDALMARDGRTVQ